MLAEGLGDLLRSEGENRLLLLDLVSERAADVQVRDDLGGDRVVARAADFEAFHEGLLRVGQLLFCRAVLEERLEFLMHVRSDLVDVHRVGADSHRERRDRVAGGRDEAGAGAVGEAVLLANAVADA